MEDSPKTQTSTGSQITDVLHDSVTATLENTQTSSSPRVHSLISGITTESLTGSDSEDFAHAQPSRHNSPTATQPSVGNKATTDNSAGQFDVDDPLINLAFSNFYLLNLFSNTITHIPSGNVQKNTDP